MIRRIDRQGEVLIWETENGTEIDELFQAGECGHKRAR